MESGKAAKDLIKSFEGLALDVYVCPAGHWAIGYGHDMGPAVPGRKPAWEHITLQEAEELLDRDIAIAEMAINDAVRVPLNQNQYDALVSWVFNLGGGNLRKSTLLKKINLQRYEEAAREFRRWVYGGGRVLLGLVRRRQREYDLFTRSV